MDNKSLAIGALCGAAATALLLRARPSTGEQPNGRSEQPNGHAQAKSTRGQPEPGRPVASQGVLSRGRVAVITGAASGIGRQTALACAELGMRVVIADVAEEALKKVKSEALALGAKEEDVTGMVCDVSNQAKVQSLKELAYKRYGAVHFLMNNAALQTNGDCSPIDHLDRWQKIIDVNLWGVVYCCQTFAPDMIRQGEPAVIVNTGSKQGITCPPGDTAYNVSKAGVKVFTEQLQHKLRNTQDCKVNAFLLVPGWTITMITTNSKKWLGRFDPSTAQDETSYDGVSDPAVARQKLVARGAWPAENVVKELFSAVNTGAPFYIICEDNETTKAMDNGRAQWAADDLIFRRVPLSRWSSQYKDEYAAVSKNFK